MKPETSRIANSEKYIICKDYKINDVNKWFDQQARWFSKDSAEMYICIHPNIKLTTSQKLDDNNFNLRSRFLEEPIN